MVERPDGLLAAVDAVASGSLRVTGQALLDVPAVELPLVDLVDLLPGVLPHVAEPQLTVLPVEGHAPWVAEAVSVDLGSSQAIRAKRVVPRDAVLHVGARTLVDV